MLHGSHNQKKKESINQADKREYNERNWFPAKLVQKPAKRWRHQTTEGDKCKGYAQSFGPLRFFSISRNNELFKVSLKEWL